MRAAPHRWSEGVERAGGAWPGHLWQRLAWGAVKGPPEGDDWIALFEAPLPLDAASSWAVRADCGAVVTFSGTARDHSEGRPGVSVLEYEAYEEQAVERMADIAAEARRRWPALGRLVLLHRVGRLEVGASAVVVVASAPHRAEAFEGARFAIDALKQTVPIWKREVWDGGESWGLEAQHLVSVDDLARPSGPGGAT